MKLKELQTSACMRSDCTCTQENRMVLGKPAREGESPAYRAWRSADPEHYETRGTLGEEAINSKAKHLALIAIVLW